jgi:hypothetical protein
MHIARHTFDASPVSDPMSHLFTLIQNTRCKITLSPESSTHKYDGGIAESRVKNVMMRHESRRPNPKAAGPKVPVENLQKRPRILASIYRLKLRKRQTHDRMFVLAENHKKKILMKLVSVLSSTSTGRIPIKRPEREFGSRYRPSCTLVRDRVLSRSTTRTARLHTQTLKLF